MNDSFEIDDATPEQSRALGRILVSVYSALEGFPLPSEQPGYYEMLTNIGHFTDKPQTRVLAAVSTAGEVLGGVVYFGDMSRYGSGGSATSVTDASGIRLLGVAPEHRRRGVGKALTRACVELARKAGHGQVILHSTQAMRVAWAMYERMGFGRSEELDFSQQGLPVYGFRLLLK